MVWLRYSVAGKLSPLPSSITNTPWSDTCTQQEHAVSTKATCYTRTIRYNDFRMFNSTLAFLFHPVFLKLPKLYSNYSASAYFCISQRKSKVGKDVVLLSSCGRVCEAVMKNTGRRERNSDSSETDLTVESNAMFIKKKPWLLAFRKIIIFLQTLLSYTESISVWPSMCKGGDNL